MDQALGGGLPRGRVIEVYGTAGRMSLTVGALAGATRKGLLTALIDPAMALDVQGLHDRGADLQRVLWLRPIGTQTALQCVDLLVEGGMFALVVLYLCDKPPPRRMDLWPRLSQRCERSGTALLGVGDQPAAGSYAAATLDLRPGPGDWQRAPGDRSVLGGRKLQVELVRSRLGPPGPASMERLVP